MNKNKIIYPIFLATIIFIISTCAPKKIERIEDKQTTNNNDQIKTEPIPNSTREIKIFSGSVPTPDPTLDDNLLKEITRPGYLRFLDNILVVLEDRTSKTTYSRMTYNCKDEFASVASQWTKDNNYDILNEINNHSADYMIHFREKNRTDGCFYKITYFFSCNSGGSYSFFIVGNDGSYIQPSSDPGFTTLRTKLDKALNCTKNPCIR